jgi:adenylosuccinate lyase
MRPTVPPFDAILVVDRALRDAGAKPRGAWKEICDAGDAQLTELRELDCELRQAREQIAALQHELAATQRERDARTLAHEAVTAIVNDCHLVLGSVAGESILAACRRVAGLVAELREKLADAPASEADRG